MPRSQGFARGDFDTSFPIDDKFLALRVAVEPTEVLERVKARRLDRSSQFAMVAAMVTSVGPYALKSVRPASQRAAMLGASASPAEITTRS